MAITRRDFLRHIGLTGFTALSWGVVACSKDEGVDPPTGTPDGGGNGNGDSSTPEVVPPPDSETSRRVFQHAVASGDPLSDAIILWTRVTTDDTAPVKVKWQIARDVAFADIAQRGEFTTDRDRDYTVKVDVTGLSAGTTYYYRFIALGGSSPVGRTRTAPSGGVSRLRFAVVSCSSYAHGYFHAYRSIAKRLDLDAVLHLGDYIYEYATAAYGAARPYDPPHEIVSLADYRTRYAHYRKDPDLQAVHRQHPFIAVWDDHESANNAWMNGAENHTPLTEGSWEERRTVAAQAYAEWMPIRELEGPKKIYRALRYGNLAEIIMLDTRLWGRDEQVPQSDPRAQDPYRQLLGQDQEAWLSDRLTKSTSQWKIIGQQVMMGQLPIFFNNDAWDGYPAARTRFLDTIKANQTNNVVVLTGDIHSSWAINLPMDPNDTTTYDRQTGVGSLAVEFVTPAVTSPGFPDALAETARQAALATPHIKFADVSKRGYVVLDVTPERTQAAWYLYTAPEQMTVNEAFAQAFATYDRENRLRQESAPAPDAPAPPGAPV
ncbi:MAG: alkaline phosphatase D family protein [Polyangiaceae bacterium]